jgi:glycosyltransferase involved in cell wall biosynthesis
MTTSTATPRVVTLVPTWQASSFIGKTLDHLAAQTYPNLEILISDDASLDDTARVCEVYASRDPRLRVIRQRHNLGWIGNVNALLREARGDYFVFAAHDDLPAPRYIERCVAALEANPNAILAFSDIELVHPQGMREEKRYTVLDGVGDRLRRARLMAAQYRSHSIPYRGVFRASAARTIGGLRRHVAGEFMADWTWLVQMSLLGEFVRIPAVLCTKVYRQTSLSMNWVNWSADLPAWTAATLSTMAVVSAARIPLREKVVLYGALAAVLARHARRWTGHAIGRVLGAIGLTRLARAVERSTAISARFCGG